MLLLSRFSRVRLCATPETAAHQAFPSLGFSRQEYWSGLPFPSPMRESEVAQLHICSSLWLNNAEGNGTLLQYSCLENPMDGGAW